MSNDFPIEPIYERQPEEPLTHYEWFHTYMLLGASRSMLSASKIFYEKGRKRQKKADENDNPKPLVSAPGAWRDAAEKWRWSERVSEWDREQREEARKRRLEWDLQTEEQYKATIDRIFQRATDADKVAKKMFNRPLTREIEKEPDGRVIIVEPAGWDLNTAVRIVAMMGKTLKDSVETKEKLDAMYNSRTLIEAFESGNITAAEAQRTLELLGYVVISPDEVVTVTPEQLRDNEMLRLQSIAKVLEVQIMQGDKTAISKMMSISRQITALQGLNLPAAKERFQPKRNKRDLSRYSQTEKEILAEITDPNRIDKESA